MKKVGIFDVDGTLARGFYIAKFPAALIADGYFDKK